MTIKTINGIAVASLKTVSGVAKAAVKTWSGEVLAAATTYATWNPSDKDADVTLSNGNLTFSAAAAGAVRSTISKSSGKWYWEITAATNTTAAGYFGIGTASTSLVNFPGATADSLGYGGNLGSIYQSAAELDTAPATFAASDVIGIAFDADAKTVKWYKNNTLQTTTSATYVPTGEVFAMVGRSGGTTTCTANFGATALTYSPPAGYNAGLYS